MAKTWDSLDPCAALAEIARDFHGRGWMAGTAGNLSVRSRDEQGRPTGDFWITASGLPKGRLALDDFLRIAIADGAVVERRRPELKPSAETAIHQVIYQCLPDVGACLHVHTIESSLVSMAAPAGADHLPLPPLEMVKGFDIWEEQPQVSLPLFENYLEVPAIAQMVLRRFRSQAPRVPALMIRGHGLTVWGKDLQQAYNRVEIAEFLMAYCAKTQRFV